MKLDCLIIKMRDIIMNADQFYTEKTKAFGIPILKNHIPLFLLLKDRQDYKLFNEVYKEWGISKSSLSDIINKYQGLGLIEKCSCSDDKRTVYLYLTDKGLRYQQMLLDFEQEFLELAYKGMSDDEKGAFERYLSLTLKNTSVK